MRVLRVGVPVASRPFSRPKRDDWNRRRHRSVCGPQAPSTLISRLPQASQPFRRCCASRMIWVGYSPHSLGSTVGYGGSPLTASVGPPPQGRASMVQRMNQLPIVPGRAGEQLKFLSSALSHSIHWLPCLALTSRCQLAMASAIAAPSPLTSRACVNGLNLAFPAAFSMGLHSPCCAYAWVGSRSPAVCALALNVSIAVISAATAPRQSMVFGVIDTTPLHGFKVICTHTKRQTRHISGPHATHCSTSLTALASPK